MASSFHFTLPTAERSLAESLNGVPRQFVEIAKKGFVVLAGVSQTHYAEVLKAVVITLESRQPPFEDLEKSLGLSQDNLSSLMAAAMLSVPLLGDSGTSDEFVLAAEKSELIPKELRAAIKPFLDVVVAERPQISRAIRRTGVSSQVLPFLSDVDIVVDVRMVFDGDAVSETMPVAILHIDTDANGAEIWFQASKIQMERLKADVDKALKRMNLAEVWAQKGSPG